MEKNSIMRDDALGSISGGHNEKVIHLHDGEICPNCAFGRIEFSRPNRFGSNEGIYYCSTCHNYITLAE